MAINADASTIWVAMSMLYARNRDGLIPETLYFLTPDQIITLVKTFGGQTVYIPTADEFYLDIMAAITAWHMKVEGQTEEWVREKYHGQIDHRKWTAVFNRINDWTLSLTKEEIEFLKIAGSTKRDR